MTTLLERSLLAFAVFTGSLAVLNDQLPAAIVTASLLLAWAIVTTAHPREPEDHP